MSPTKILYLSSNKIWGGSEVLWTRSAQRLIEQGMQVRAATWYPFSFLKDCLVDERRFIDLNDRYPDRLISRLSRRLKIRKNKPKDFLTDQILAFKPDLVIISQGNNLDGLPFMRLCHANKIPFVTLTHLVTESFWPALNDEKIDLLSFLYSRSSMNFFVSRYIMDLHHKMLAADPVNCSLTYNPFTPSGNTEIPYPSLVNGHYQVALLGRLENFHKGYDLLIDILSNDKWKQRNIIFSVFGTGPHSGLLKRMIERNNITNMFIHEYANDIASVWKDHHILLMPSRMEGQSLSLIESMWFSRAAILTRVGGVEELVEDQVSGFIADYPTAQHIDEAMERAWNNREKWEEMGKTARKLIAQKHPADAVAYFNAQISDLKY